MDTYARLHAPVPRPSRSLSPGRKAQVDAADGVGNAQAYQGMERFFAEGVGASIERVEAQVVNAVRSVNLVQDLVDSLEARVAALEVKGTTTMLSKDARLAEFTTPVAKPFENSSFVGSPPTESLSTFDERLRQRFHELRQWQADVELAVRQFIGEARKNSANGSFVAPTNGEGQRVAFSNACSAPVMIARREPIVADPLDSTFDHRARDVAKRTEVTIGQLEGDLAVLRRELAVDDRPMASTLADDRRRFGPPSSDWPADASQEEVNRLYEDLMRLEERAKATSSSIRPPYGGRGGAPVPGRRIGSNGMYGAVGAHQRSVSASSAGRARRR